MPKNPLRKTVALVALVVIAAACGDDDGGTDPGQGAGGDASATAAGPVSGDVVIFAYEDTLFPFIQDPFQEANPDLNIEGVPFGDASDTVTKLRGGFQADVVETCAGEMDQLIRGGFLQPIDTSRIPVWDDIYPFMKEGQGVEVDGEFWMAPTQGGIDGIVYNADEIPEGVITGYRTLFEGDWEGQIALENDSTDSMPMVAAALGFPSVFELDSSQIEQVRDYLINTDRVRTVFDEDAQLINLMQQGEVLAVQAGPELVRVLNKEGGNFKFITPEEGSVSWVCGLSISENAENLDAAYAFINHMLDPETQANVAVELEYWGSNPAILDAADQKTIDNLRLDEAESVVTNSIPELIPENIDEWEDAWRQYLAS
ncbi:MAG TPA: extracellular solute-binding protein [Actinomycetota bacterium]|nr:extracellular solute-binding protein [Actinomycetota bacterium]